MGLKRAELRSKKKKAIGAGYDRTAAKRIAETGEDPVAETEIQYAKGGVVKYKKGGVVKTSKNKTKHRKPKPGITAPYGGDM